MKVLVVGSGGREHALAWKLAQSERVQTVYVAPGNGGTALDTRLRNVPLTDIHALADFAQSEKVALTVVGPEAPLAAGIVDLFRAQIEKQDAAFVAKVDKNFATVDKILAKYKTQDGGFETYDKVKENDRKALVGPVNTLAEDLSTLRGKLGLN